jgi:transposase InsO family protein
VSSTSASAVIPKLDQLFATFGTPLVVRADNGPPFNGHEFVKFSQVLGFKHRKVTPLWPRANGEVERFVKALKKFIKAAKTEGKNWRKELQVFLLLKFRLLYLKLNNHHHYEGQQGDEFLGRYLIYRNYAYGL